MPRLRVILPCAAVTLLTGGLAAGLAWRWLARDALAQRAGVRLPFRHIVRPRGNDFRLLRAGLALLPLTWGGLVVGSPLLPSAFPGLSFAWLWPGWGLVVALPILLCGGLAAHLGVTYARAGRLLAGEAEIEWRARAWLRPWAVHLVTIGVLALPALAVGLILPFRWPGLTLLRAAIALCAVAPAIGAVVALGPMLDALGARWIPIDAAARTGTPRWVSPVAFLSLAFVWGVVVARGVETASLTSPFVARPSGSAPVSPRVWKVALPDGTLSGAGIPCDGDIVDYVVVPTGTIAWCEGWNGERRRTVTTFLYVPTDLLAADLGRSDRFWLPVVPGTPVIGVPGGVVALVQDGPNVERFASIFPIAPGAEHPLTARLTGWRLPTGTRSPDEMIPTHTGIDLHWIGGDGDRWVVLDDSLEPAGVSPLDRLVARFGAPWLCALLVAAALTLASLLLAARRPARAGAQGTASGPALLRHPRAHRLVERGASHRGAGAPGERSWLGWGGAPPPRSVAGSPSRRAMRSGRSVRRPRPPPRGPIRRLPERNPGAAAARRLPRPPAGGDRCRRRDPRARPGPLPRARLAGVDRAAPDDRREELTRRQARSGPVERGSGGG